MTKTVVRNSDDKVVNVIEWDPEGGWPVPEGYRLEDPDKFPFIPDTL